MTETAINDLFKGKKGSTEIKVALDLLLRRGLATLRKEETKGRPVTIWTPLFPHSPPFSATGDGSR